MAEEPDPLSVTDSKSTLSAASVEASISETGVDLPQRQKRGRRKRKRGTAATSDDSSEIKTETSDVTEMTRHLTERKYEYLDHTADVQLHAWGDSMEEAFEQCAVAMFGYIAHELRGVRLTHRIEFEANGHDLESLLFNFLNEVLGQHYENNYFIFADVCLTVFEATAHSSDDSDELAVFRVKGYGRGEAFDRSLHESGTEVKAITYSAMQILDRGEAHGKGLEVDKPKCELLVIVDI